MFPLHDLIFLSQKNFDEILLIALQYNTKREAAKPSALSSGKTDKYESLTGEEILPFNQSQIIRKQNLHILLW